MVGEILFYSHFILLIGLTILFFILFGNILLTTIYLFFSILIFFMGLFATNSIKHSIFLISFILKKKESLLITKIWDFNKTILEKWSDVNLLIAINSAKTNRKMKKGLKNIANNLREIANKLDKATEKIISSIDIKRENGADKENITLKDKELYINSEKIK